MDRNLAVIINESSLCREKSDYDDFYAAGKVEVEEQLNNARYFVEKIEEYISGEQIISKFLGTFHRM